MSPRFPRSVLGAALAVAVLSPAAPAVAAPAPGGSAGGSVRLLVGADSAAGQRAVTRLVRASGARTRERIPRLGVRVVSVPARRAAALERRLRRTRAIGTVEPDGRAHQQEVLPDDPAFPTASSASGSTLGGIAAWGWTRTRTTEAWDITMGDPAIVVAVIDSGLRPDTLRDWDGRTVPGYNVLQGNAATDATTNDHGTHVAGVVALAAGNGTGAAGYCPRCRVMPILVNDGSGTTAAWSDLAAGLVWAADHGARVANLSYAGTSRSATMESAVAYARSRGVVVVAAAGNAGCDCPTYPSATPGVLGVAALESSLQRASVSNHGSWVALAAPTGNPTGWPMINGAPGYTGSGGTSIAAPAVAGIAGLLLSARPSLTGAEVEQALKGSAKAAPFTVGAGEVDALGAMNAIGLTDPQPASPPVNTSAPVVLRSVNGMTSLAPLSGAPEVGQTLARGQGGWTGSAPLRISRVDWQRCAADGSGCVTVSNSYRYVVAAADAGHVFRLVVTVGNALGKTAATSAATAPVGGASTPPPPATPLPPPPPPPPATPPPPPPPATTTSATFSGTFSAKRPVLRFTLPAGAGPAAARLTYTASKCGAQLTLGLRDAAGQAASLTGPSVLGLDRDVAAGTLTYEVSGSTRCAVSLAVTVRAP